MKSFMKKCIITICAISAAVTVSAASVYATDGFRSGPASTAAVTDTTNKSVSADDKTVSASGGQNGATSVTTQATAANTVQTKKYLTKWGGFFWFLLSVVVNFILSCWVGNKFYNLSKRSSQSSAEIRALRKDIEEKFASTLRDINEPAIDIINRNESYARNEEGIEMPETRAKVEINDEEREILGRWDMKRTASATSEEKEPQSVRRAYAPTRAMSGIEFEDSDDRETDTAAAEEKAPSKMNTIAKAGNKAGSKAKDFLSNIFPFDE